MGVLRYRITVWLHGYIFIHDYFKLNVTTVGATSLNGVDMNEDECHGGVVTVMSSWCDVVRPCEQMINKSLTTKLQKINNGIQFLKRERQEQEKGKKKNTTGTKPQAAILAPESPVWSGLLRGLAGALRLWRGWQVGRDLLLRTLFVP